MPLKERQVIVQETSSDELIEQIIQRLKSEIQLSASVVSPKEVMTPKEVKHQLQISHTTLDTWTKKGILKSYSYGGRKIYYKYSEIISALIPVEV